MLRNNDAINKDTKMQMLKEEIKECIELIHLNEVSYSFATDEELITALIYEKISLGHRHSYLINRIRELQKLNDEKIGVTV